MLSSTTYDAIHETFFWVSIVLAASLAGAGAAVGRRRDSGAEALTAWYVVYQRLGLVASPFFYLLLYLLVTGICEAGEQDDMCRWRRCAVQFALSLVPIALVYHATHYYTILVDGVAAPAARRGSIRSRDGTCSPVAPPMPGPLDMGVIWHTQVLLMLGGHVVAVYLAHVVALRVFPSHRQGVVSQLPMLALMVAYTCLGLWVLSLPLAVPQVLPIG